MGLPAPEVSTMQGFRPAETRAGGAGAAAWLPPAGSQRGTAFLAQSRPALGASPRLWGQLLPAGGMSHNPSAPCEQTPPACLCVAGRGRCSAAVPAAKGGPYLCIRNDMRLKMIGPCAE